MAQTLGSIIMSFAATAWIAAVVCAIQMVRHRKPGVSLFHLGVNGIAFFSGERFLPSAGPWRRGFLWAFVAFFLCVVAMMAVGTTAAVTQ